VSPSALVLLWALLGICKLAELRRIKVIIASLVFDRVIIVAALVVVRSIFLRALYSLKVSQVQVLYVKRLASAVVRLFNHDKDFIIS
jgi:hypothetical protein